MQRKKLVLIAAVIAGVMSIGSVAALAGTIFSTSPTLSLTAQKSMWNRRILGSGTYDYAVTAQSNHACGMRRGHPVTMYANGSIIVGSATTGWFGNYSITSAQVPAGTYHVHTTVPGRIFGHYGNTFICNDAISPTRKVVLPLNH